MKVPEIRTPLPGPKAKAIIDRDRQYVSPSYTRDYPFVISVGLAVSEIFSRVEAKKKSGLVIAGFLTLLIGVATALSIRGQRLREAAKKHLEHTNMLLNATLANMPHGICMAEKPKKKAPVRAPSASGPMPISRIKSRPMVALAARKKWLAT